MESPQPKFDSMGYMEDPKHPSEVVVNGRTDAKPDAAEKLHFRYGPSPVEVQEEILASLKRIELLLISMSLQFVQCSPKDGQ